MVNEIAKRAAKAKGTVVFKEPTIPYGGSFLRPDLIVLADGNATVMGVAIVADGGLQAGARAKIDKYGAPGPQTAILAFIRRNHPGIEAVRHAPAVWTARGLVAPATKKALKMVGCTNGDCRLFAWMVIRGSLRTYHQYFRSTFVV